MPSCSHVFQPTSIIFELVQDIIGINLLTEFHEDQTINVASRVLTRFYYSPIRNCPAPWRPCFSTNRHHFWTRPRYYWDESSDQVSLRLEINVASRVLTRFYYSHIRKNALPFGSHFFSSKHNYFQTHPRYHWDQSSDQISWRLDNQCGF